MIVSVGKYFYVALAKGGLTEDHVIIVSIRHSIQSTIYLDSSQKMELNNWKEAFHAYFGTKGLVPVFYEHFIPRERGHHFHIQVVPVPKSVSIDDVSDAFRRAGNRVNVRNRIRWKFLSNYDDIKQIVGSEEPYLGLELPGYNNYNNNTMVARLEQKTPASLGRAGCSDLLQCPHLEDWKSCIQPNQVETKLTLDFRNNFQMFDPFRKHLLK